MREEGLASPWGQLEFRALREFLGARLWWASEKGLISLLATRVCPGVTKLLGSDGPNLPSTDGKTEALEVGPSPSPQATVGAKPGLLPLGTALSLSPSGPPLHPKGPIEKVA